MSNHAVFTVLLNFSEYIINLSSGLKKFTKHIQFKANWDIKGKHWNNWDKNTQHVLLKIQCDNDLKKKWLAYMNKRKLKTKLCK